MGPSARVILLTGPVNSGKSTCLQAAHAAFPERITGAIAAGSFSGTQKHFTVHLLGAEAGALRSTTPAAGEERLSVGQYSLSADVVARTRAHLEGALQEAGKVVCVDEFGPLELYKHSGLWPVFPSIVSSRSHVVIVVRARCLADMKELLAVHGIRTHDFVHLPGNPASRFIEFLRRVVPELDPVD